MLDDNRTMDAGLRATVTVLRSWFMEKEGASSVWFQQSQGKRVVDLDSAGRFF